MLNLHNIFNRLKAEMSIRSDAEMAHRLGITPRRICQCKVESFVPYKHIVSLAESENLSLDYIFFGKK